MSDVVNVFKEISNLDVSPQFNSYSKVVIHIDDETTVEYGNDSGRTLEFDNPFGTQDMAQTILASLQRSGYQYQPYDAQGTILDPAAEIGDALSATNVYGGIYTRSRNFGRLMKADVSAPHEEEINHEYQFESPQEREFKRETGKLSARLIIAESTIESQASRIDGLSEEVSTIRQSAGQISAEVMLKEGGSSSTFSWTLNNSSWVLKSNNTEVFKADASGVKVTGEITATKITASSGTIGGFTITDSAIYKNATELGKQPKKGGVYIGTDGLWVIAKEESDGTRKGYFRADSSGDVRANNMILSGTLTIGSDTITANRLRIGADSAYTNQNTWSTGAGYGYSYNHATDRSSGSYPSFFKVRGSLQCDDISIGGNTCAKYMAIINGVHIPYWGYGAPY